MSEDPLNGELPPDLLPSATGKLEPEQIERLWEVFVAIANFWGDADPTPLWSQWLEFLELRTAQAPSYLEEYRNAIRVLDDRKRGQSDPGLTKLLSASGVPPRDPVTTPLGHLKRYVVDEFIWVWLATGGFRTYGAGNYNGYISGSRFAVRPPYRGLLAPVEVSASPPPRNPADEEPRGNGSSK
jgi:hypothetical protein